MHVVHTLQKVHMYAESMLKSNQWERNNKLDGRLQFQRYISHRKNGNYKRLRSLSGRWVFF
jgi:hypothetical protein